MPTRLFSLLVALLLLSGADRTWAQLLPFGSNKLPTLTFTEAYTDTLVSNEFGYEQIPDTSLTVNLTASMSGVVVADLLPEGGALTLDAANLHLNLPLADAIASQASGFEVLTWEFVTFDPNLGEEIVFGTVKLQYNATELKITVTIADNPSEFSIYAAHEAGSDEVLEDLTDFVSFSLGAYGFENLTLYIDGTAETFERTVGTGEDQQTFTNLARVRLTGSIDSVDPTVTMTKPAPNAVVTDETYLATGTWADTYGIFLVEVQLNDGPFMPATINGNQWSCELSGFLVGANTVTVRATDVDSHTRTLNPRPFRFSEMSNLTVNAAGDGAGKISASFFANTLVYDPTKTTPRSQTKQKSGTALTITAVPAAGSVFDGWTSNKTLTPAQLASPKIKFQHLPNLTLTAHFKVNPFTPVKGRYNGLATGADTAGTGLFSVTLATTGSFTGTLKVGALQLPVKGKFSNEGRYTGSVTAAGVSYNVDLTLNTTGTGDQKIVGTVAGGTVDVTIDGLRSPFDKKLLPAPQIGVYNLLLPPAAGQADPYPQGIGYGRATVSPAGSIKFAGRLGSGTAFSASSYLSVEGKWPFFVLLYGKRGCVAGTAVFDLAAASSDVTGQFAWYKPADVRPGTFFPETFSGQSTMLGAKFVKPLAGERLLLDPTGAGPLDLAAPATATLPALDATLNATLGTNHKLTATGTGSVTSATATITANTGIFTGSFFEGTTKRTFNGIVVGPKVQQAGGYLLRAPRTGAVTLVPPPSAPED